MQTSWSDLILASALPVVEVFLMCLAGAAFAWKVRSPIFRKCEASCSMKHIHALSSSQLYKMRESYWMCNLRCASEYRLDAETREAELPAPHHPQP
jgi:hypothetical protein